MDSSISASSVTTTTDRRDRNARWQKAQRTRRWGALIVLLALFVAGVFFFRGAREKLFSLRVSAGDPVGPRHRLVVLLAELGKQRGLRIETHSTIGSEDAIVKVSRKELDVAFVQGDIPAPSSVRQVASLAVEPMHLLVRASLHGKGIESLRGKRVNTGAVGSGTHALALRALGLAGLKPGADFSEENRTYQQLLELPAEQFPDAVFSVSLAPAPFVEELINKQGMRLAHLAVAEGLALRDQAYEPVIVPAFTYRVVPPEPATPISTVGARLIVVCHRDTPAPAIVRMLEVLTDGAYVRKAGVRGLKADVSGSQNDLPWHEGAERFRQRNDPLLTSEVVDYLENLRSFLVSAVVALILFWRWIMRRQESGFTFYMNEITRVEQQATQAEASAAGKEEFRRLRRRLSELKNEALARQAAGELTDHSLMIGFLIHLNDVRDYLNFLIEQASRDRH